MSKEKYGQFPIVGIGASAGGLEALSEFVKAVPEDSGLAYVIVQHLAPDHPSIMDQLLESHTPIPVRKIEDGMAVEPDTIFVIPAGPSLTLKDGALHLHDRDPDKHVRTPIDEFLSSLAEERGKSAFAVILSGTGSDGTQGVRAIKTAGGFAIVQESDSARFPGMPDSAAATGLVDFVLTPKAIPDRLIDIVRHREKLSSDRSSEELQEEIKGSLDKILGLIDDENGHDFSDYKPGTLIRRIERRMSLLRIADAETFAQRLEKSDEERERLLQDFLIGVTRFFRNPEAFDRLKQDVVLPLLDRDQSRFRIWVPGCSTGEETYSIAMLFSEAMKEAGDHRPCQIFGTDIDAAALRRARSGTYAKSQLDGLSPERRDRFLVQSEGDCQISQELREQCVFAPHNLLQDPPFSRLDLISCRNLFIYLNSDSQDTIIKRFHYALNEKGYLFLGPSESLGKQEKYFNTLDREVRLYQRNDAEPPGFSTLAMSSEDGARRQRRISEQTGQGQTQLQTPAEPDFEQQVSSFFLREAAPPFAVVNAQDEISYISERMAPFVQPSMGTVSASLDQFLARELRLPVRSVIGEARKSKAQALVKNVVVDDGSGPSLFDIAAKPTPFADGHVLITLQPVRTQDAADLADATQIRSQTERDLVERELMLTKQQLSSTLSDYETTEQELRSSNEELLSMNEELQSSNEELETSREELQSINEELETINAELTENNRQLIEANSDLKNLFESTDIATVFLDQNLRVRRFTPNARRLFGIRERDIDRELSDLKWAVSYDHLEEDAEQCGATLQTVEREVRIDATDETFLLRLQPYRRTDDRIDGCVMSMIDITDRKKFERQLAANAEVLERQYSELETLYDTTPVGLSLVDSDLRWIRINERLAEINGFPSGDHIGKKQEELIPDIDGKIREMQSEVLRTGKPISGLEITGVTPAEPDRTRHWIVDYYPVRQAGELFAVGCCVQEVTKQVEAARAVNEAVATHNVLLSELQHRVKNTMATVLAIVQFSAKNATDIGTFTDTLRNRLSAIARTHDVLSSSGWEGTTIEDVVRRELAPYAEGSTERFEYKGDTIGISAKQMLSLSLALHELATNAVKYGALSVAGGRVDVRARTSGDGQVHLKWHEKGGPAVKAPDKTGSGFGTLLLTQILGPDLQGSVQLDYAMDGLIFELQFPRKSDRIEE
ncbi:MAG: chemotaxis protein CheB [Pontixanthobacter sp.]